MKSVLTLVLVTGPAASVIAQVPPTTPAPLTRMPHTAIDHPEFVTAAEVSERSRNALDLERVWAGARRASEGHATQQVILVPQFWFAWSQFRSGTRIFTAREKEKP